MALNDALNLLTDADANLIVTGYTGPNQPAIGRALAERLGRRFVNVETRLEEHTGMPLDDIRTIYGQAHLKTLESEVFGEVLLYRGAVIRVSGETLSHGTHLAQLAQTGPVICLVATLGAVLSRLHLSMGARFHNPAERDLALGGLRSAWWARGKPGVYDVDATYLDEAATVNAIIQQWQTIALKRG